MTIYPMVLLLLLPGQQKPPPDTPEDRARRAAIVDRIMAERIHPKLKPPEVIVAEAQAPVVVREFVQGRQLKTLTFEQPDLQTHDGEIELEEPVMPVPFNINNAVLERENLDRWVFGDGVAEQDRRSHLQFLLSKKIDQIMKDHEINRAQLEKLRLAGSGDIKRFFDRVQERREESEVARKNYKTGRLLLDNLEPLATEFQQGPFGDDSFFAKTLKKIENDSKAATKDGRE